MRARSRRSGGRSPRSSTRRSSRRCARRAREHPDGATLYRVPLTLAPTAPTIGRCSSTPPSCRCAASRRRRSRSARSCIIEDITARVQLEEQLQISEKMASIGLLAAGVAHEVNTPLTGISSFTQMLLEGADPERSEDAAAREDRAADVPRREDRQRPAEPLAAGRRPATERADVDLNAVVNDVLVAARAPVRGRQASRCAASCRRRAGGRARHRAPAAAGVPEPVPQRPRRDAERRLADGHDARRRRPGRSSRSPTPAPASRPSTRAHLRSVLHDQGHRPGHRPRPVDHLRHRARARRHDSLRQRGRPGHPVHAGAAAAPRRRARAQRPT